MPLSRLLLTVMVLSAEPRRLYAVPAVTKSWGSNGTQVIHGYVNRSGKLVIAPRWDSASPFSEGLAVGSSRHWYYGDVTGVDRQPDAELFDEQGRVVLRARSIAPPSEGRVVYSDGNRWRWVDLKAPDAGSPDFAFLGGFSEGLSPAAVSQDGGEPALGYIDRSGRMAISPRFRFAGPFVSGAARVSADGRTFGLIDKTGAVLLELEHREVELGHDAWVVVRDEDLLYRYADVHGAKVSLEERFDYASVFVGKYATAMKRTADGTVDYGYIKRDGTWLVKRHSPGSFYPAESMTGFHDGAAVVAEYVKDGWTYCYVDEAGKKLFGGRSFEQAGPFDDGLALVTLMRAGAQRFALIDTKGATVWEGPRVEGE